ncbi:MAG: vWA domain-containing protein [Chloroflexota bacterium]
MIKKSKLSPSIVVFLLISLVLLIFSACGGGEAPTQDTAEEAAEEMVEEVEEVFEADEEMAEEEIDIEPEKELDETIGAEASESEGGSPFDPNEGSKAQPTRASVEAALAEVDGVRIVDELSEVVLSAEIVDDNADWTNYMLYLESYTGPRVEFLNILERHTVTLLDEMGQPLAGVPVEFVAEDQIVGRTVTHSDGTFTVFPNALDLLSDQASQLEIRILNTDTSFQLILGNSAIWEFELNMSSPTQPETAVLDIALVIDVSGSMADDIDALLAALNSVGSRLNALDTSADFRVAFVEYRDQEFDGVSEAPMLQTIDFSLIDIGYFDQLQRINPSGGGNESEMLAEGLFFAVDELSWSAAAESKMILLLADAPPHYPSLDGSYTNSIQAAAEKGIKVHTIGATGLNNQGEYILRQIAQYTGGKHIFFALQEGFVPNLTPLDPNGNQPQNIQIEGLENLIINLIEDELNQVEQ